MPSAVVLVVLGAALLHVLWNTLVKVAPDGYLATVLIAGGGGLWCAAALPFLPAIHGAAWWNVAGSVVAQVIYYPMVAAAYRAGDMSLAYPLMRGTAPLLVATVSWPLIGERLTGAEWVGLALICAGIWGIGLGSSLGANRGATPVAPPSTTTDRPPPPATDIRPKRNRKAIVLSLVTACVIASYTLIDGAGSRASGAPATYTAWIFLFTAIPVVGIAVARRRKQLRAELRHRWWVALLGGAANVGAYGLVLWAFTRAPVAAVAALRETSILFATVVAVLFLKEKVNRYRIAATLFIVGGAIVLRLA